jgi:hypothetical protein
MLYAMLLSIETSQTTLYRLKLRLLIPVNLKLNPMKFKHFGFIGGWVRPKKCNKATP